MAFKDYSGQRHGRLQFVSFHDRRNSVTRWLAKCNCGNEVIVQVSNVLNGFTTSCGCFRKESASSFHSTHGLTGTLTHRRWLAMRERCQKSVDYLRKGITVCSAWNDRNGGFVRFLANMGECPSKDHTLDRKDNAKGYTPANCRWATRYEQNQNQTSNVMITYKGRTLCAAQWARELGLTPKTFRSRVYAKWPIERLMQPKH